MKNIIVASNNEHKIKEIKEILKDFPYKIISLKEANINIEVEEDGNTFLENAYKKAKEIFDVTENSMVLADDSGLSVEALNGAPGVLSARFCGEHGNDSKNNEKLLYLLKDCKNKKAKFVCAMVLIVDEKNIIKVEGEVEGCIIDKAVGENGFGYDPLFYFPQYKMTFAEMDSNLKNSISHRGKALDLLKEALKENLNIK
jgi:XTP/dITP diphosphohydrolase